MLDIAIDPQGMMPNIFIDGTMQFKHEVMAFDCPFCVGDSSDSVEKRGPASTVF
jgi:hypothetical protein